MYAALALLFMIPALVSRPTRSSLRSSEGSNRFLELQWGTEKDANFSYASGNSDPGRGFGHICYTVDDLTTEVARLDAFGTVQWKKRPEDGTMKYIAFILDPDNYWIEVIGNAAR